MKDAIKINKADNVAVALRELKAGESFFGATLDTDVPMGHKIAITEIGLGQDVIKYGLPIGHATKDIPRGAWVHTHNMATGLSGELSYTYEPSTTELPKREPTTFLGYRREGGRVGIRNEIWIIPTVGCVNDVAKRLAKEGEALVSGSLEGVWAYTHPYGCSQTGGDHETTKRLLASLAHHPNAAAVLIVTLGCENLTEEQFREALGDFDGERIKFLSCQSSEDEIAEGKELLSSLAERAKRYEREPIPSSELIVGMKCGGSDGLSGITANPTVGCFSDLLISMGGTTVLTEVPEMFGAETLLMNRAKNEEVFEKTVKMINSFKSYFLSHGENVYENPSPGNKKGGITTLEDKSCGCVQKGGSAPVSDVIGYGERITERGLNLLAGPGNDLVSATALTAAGAHLVLFTTGRGTPFGAPAPTMKLATNTELATRKSSWIDFSAGTVAEGEDTPESVAARLYELVIEIASGKRTRAEENGCREIAIFKDGVTL
ncbi:MAG: altronate dehydratase [Clostridia bacterium]|nr:altronate dehydratase [Clostridia bacterium]